MTAPSMSDSAVNMRNWVEKPGNRERKRESNRRWYAKARANGDVTKTNTEVTRFRKHGTTKAQFEDLIVLQGGGCAICSRPGDWSSLVIDHDHGCCPGQFSCGQCIRGALCKACNTALGLLQESDSLVAKALSYMNRKR